MVVVALLVAPVPLVALVAMLRRYEIHLTMRPNRRRDEEP